jgi:hypothetical protein
MKYDCVIICMHCVNLCVRAHVIAAAAPDTFLPLYILLLPLLCLPRYLHMCAVLYSVDTCNPALLPIVPTHLPHLSSLTQKIHSDVMHKHDDEHSCSKSLEQ